MKSSVFITLVIGLLLASCSKDSDEVMDPGEVVDFSGDYEGVIDCNGPLADDNGETMAITIKREAGSEKKYRVFLINDDDLLGFEAIQDGRVLNLPKQIHNEGGNVDVITIEGVFNQVVEETVSFDFTFNVDDEGESQCTFTLVKQ